MARMDKSVKGSVDEPIAGLVRMVNECQEYYTTSSCSGRVMVVGTDASSTINQKKNLQWQFVSHQVIDPKKFHELYTRIFREIMPRDYSSMSLKFEPFILHVRAGSLEAGRELLQVGLASGQRNSGLMLSKSGQVTVAIRGTATLEVPLIHKGILLVKSDYLEEVVKVANEKMEANMINIDRFVVNLEKLLCSNK